VCFNDFFFSQNQSTKPWNHFSEKIDLQVLTSTYCRCIGKLSREMREEVSELEDDDSSCDFHPGDDLTDIEEQREVAANEHAARQKEERDERAARPPKGKK
jgi:hypothetical protein